MMETMQLLRKAHRKATIKKVIKTTTVDGTEIKTKHFERIGEGSLKAMASGATAQSGVDYEDVIRQAHKNANKPRSEAKWLRTRAATDAKRAARHKSSKNTVPSK